MLPHPLQRRGAPLASTLRVIAAAAALIACYPLPASAQAPAASTGAAAPYTEQELEQLVGRIALYPDDLVAVILPASTNPLQIVQADRFLDQRKSNPKLELNAGWDDAVKTLCNYPDIVKTMSQDLDWTAQLGEAVVADVGEVMEAVQAFRRKANAAGNLKSDDKTKVVVEQEVITIAPANPEVVYVPTYNPSTVVVAGGYPAYTYYPAPYPSYWYPYAPGAAFAGGVIWGAALGAIWSGNHYHGSWGGGGNNNINIDRGDINIDRERNVNRGDRTNVAGGDRTNINRGGDRTNVGASRGQSTQWKSNKKPGQVSGSVGTGQRPRAGDARAGGGAGGNRPTAGTGAGAGAAGNRAGAGGGGRPSTSQMGAGPHGGALDGMGSARQTQMDSARGAASRGNGGAYGGGAGAGGGARASAPSRPSPSAGGFSGGGGARAGGGGARGGGGGRGGGGRR